MELLSLYIHKHDFLFEEPETINFGGAYYFKFSLVKEGEIQIEKKENKDYIPNFYNNKIYNISAIVGNNGAGKTSILKILNRTVDSKSIFIYRHNEDFYIRNTTDLKIRTDFKFEVYEGDNGDDLYPLYYSSLIDPDVKDFYSPISQSNLINDSLNNYYFDTIINQIFFMSKKSKLIKEIYNELPTYNTVGVNVNNMPKDIFTGNIIYSESDTGKNIKMQLEMLWSHYNVADNISLHDDNDFIRNFEIFMLSLLVSDDTYAVTNSNGNRIGFQEVLEKDTFKEKLEEFLRKRINNIDEPTFETLKTFFNIDFESEEDLITKLKQNKLIQIAGGFDFKMINNHIIQTIIRYSRVFRLYDFITSNQSRILNIKNKSQLTLAVDQSDTRNYLEEFITLYQDVYESIQYITFDFRIFNIRPNKKLSTGEKSLLNFFSAIYRFTLKKENHIRQKKNYLLLLDEPETGYHAIWKKRFISSINKILPELFKELKEQPNIQIIFTTHDALTLSDIPNYAISYLKRGENGSLKLFNYSDPDRPQKSFGANITDLLADSFFVDDGLIGDFAKSKIQETIDWLRKLEIEGNNDYLSYKNRNYYRKIISLIGEPLLQKKLEDMYYILFPDDLKTDKEEARRRINEIARSSGLNIDFKD